MNREEKVLIELCNAFAQGEQIRLNGGFDFAKLYKLSRAHNLTAICHCALQNIQNGSDIPDKFKEALLNCFYDIVYNSQRQENCIDELRELFSASKTPYILFKGARLRDYYPVAQVRAMGDIDLLIKQEDRDRVKKLLTGAGFKCTLQNGPVYSYEKNDVLVEVHTALISEYNVYPFDRPFEFARLNGFEGELDCNFHFAYLIAHTAHHFRFYGAGIKLILDLALMQKNEGIDFDTVFKHLKAAGLDTFAKIILTVCCKWFNVGKAFLDENCHAVIKTEDFLCSSGAFGAELDNKGAVITRRELEQGHSTSSFMLKLRLAFPSYEKMREIDYIRFLDGRKYLTVYAWFYRLFYILKNKKSLMKNAVSSLGDDKTTAQAYEQLEFFEEIGLL